MLQKLSIQRYTSIQCTSRVPSKCTNLCLLWVIQDLISTPHLRQVPARRTGEFLKRSEYPGPGSPWVFLAILYPPMWSKRSISAKMQETVNQDWWFRVTNWYCKTWYCTLSPFVNIKTHDKQWKEQLVEFCHFVQLLSPRHETRVKVGCSLVELA